MAQRCRATLRGGDLVGRYGGDELVALLPRADLAAARASAERLVAVAAEPVHVAEADVPISVSVGIAVAPRRGDLVGLLGHADAALYAVKRAGRGRAIAFDGLVSGLTEPAARACPPAAVPGQRSPAVLPGTPA